MSPDHLKPLTIIAIPAVTIVPAGARRVANSGVRP
jgi:hypothetical protein